MRGKRLLVVGLLVALLAALAATLAAGATGCSLTEAKDKAALAAALAEFEVKAIPLGATIQSTDIGATVTSDGTPVAAAIKEGLAGIADEWQSVIDKAKKVPGADAAAAEKAWSDLQAAADSVPVGALAGEAGAIVGGPLSDLMTVRKDLAAAATSVK
jgi:hypothetical protein